MIDRRFVAEMTKFYTQNGALHWSHRNWIARHLVEAGKQVPADDRAMLDAISEI